MKKFLIAAALGAAAVATIYFLLPDDEPKKTKKTKKEEPAEETKPLTDAEKVKIEYEALNNTVRQSDGATFQSVTIPVPNPIRITTCEEAVEKMEGTGVFYFGANWCPWCRNLLPVLCDTCTKMGIDPIYYVNLDSDKSLYKIENDELVQTQAPSEAYKKLVEKVDACCVDFVLHEGDKEYNTGERRIGLPTVAVFKEGVLINHHIGTVDLEEGQTKYSPLSDVQTVKLELALEDKLKSVAAVPAETCGENGCF